MKIVLWAVSALVLLTLAGLTGAALRFSQAISRIEAELTAAPAGAPRDDLPAPVAAFAARGMLGAAPAGAVRFTQSGEMRLRQGGDWQPFAARQTDATAGPGFAWVAVQRLGPLPLMRALDSYVDGAGLLDIRLLGAVRVASVSGPEASLGEALRYLAELPWFPDAILTNREIRWSEGPEGVSATLETDGGPVQVTFGFDAAGDIVSFVARDRPARQPDGSLVALDWRGSCSDYAEIGGRRVPLRGEVGYDYPEGYEPYFRLRVLSYSPLATSSS